jgi:integrase
MAQLKLTVRAIERLAAPDPSGKQKLYFDTELRGFGVLVSGVTASKSFIVQRDLRGGRTRRVTVGPTNVLTLDAAREQAKLILADFYRGVDPKVAARGKRTLRQALEAYVAGNRLRASSVRDYERSITRHLGPWLSRPLSEITPEMVRERHTAIAAAVRAEGRYPGEVAANTTMRVLRSIWNHASEGDPELPPCPVRALRRQWYAEHRRSRFVTPDQLPTFFAAVRALPSPVAADFVSMLLFTGLRRTECASLEWTDVDLVGRVLRIPATRTKSARKLDLPITDYVHDLLVARRALGKTRFVFPSNSKAGHIIEPKNILQQVAKTCGITVSAHDLRRTYCTVAESSDISPLALKALVNHSLGGDVTSGYIQMTVERLREPAQRVCDKMKALARVSIVS